MMLNSLNIPNKAICISGNGQDMLFFPGPGVLQLNTTMKIWCLTSFVANVDDTVYDDMNGVSYFSTL